MWLKSCALDCRVWDDSTQITLSQQSTERLATSKHLRLSCPPCNLLMLTPKAKTHERIESVVVVALVEMHLVSGFYSRAGLGIVQTTRQPSPSVNTC